MKSFLRKDFQQNKLCKMRHFRNLLTKYEVIFLNVSLNFFKHGFLVIFRSDLYEF